MKYYIPIILAGALNAVAIESVDINLNVRHSVGGVSEFDREAFIVLHAGLTDGDWDSDAQRESFLNDYDVYLGRNNGSLPWNLSQTTENPSNPGWCNHANMLTRGNNARSNYASETAAHALEFRANKMMIGGQMSMYPNGQTNGNGFAIADYDALGDYFEYYLTHFHGTGGTDGEPKPAMVEVVNEPFVSASKYGTTRENIAHMHNAVAARIKQSHSDVMVGGYTAAHPAYEGNNFGHWDTNWKMFIDVAGTNMDFFSLHLYDNPGGSTNVLEHTYRSGSNVEALLDMVEHYSMLKLGEVKPFNISEYGSLSVTSDAPYDPKNDWVDVRSFSTIMMQLLERPDRIIQAIPFMILKADNWGRSENGYPYPTRLLYRVNELTDPLTREGPWDYTHRIKFFELWKEVRGTRVDTLSDDPDIQVDAYVDGTDAFVIVSSLDHTGPRTVDLNLFGATAPDQIVVKHSYANAAGMPTLDIYTTNAVSSVTLGASATMVLKFVHASPVVQDETSIETKYYATTYLQPIYENTAIAFHINDVVTDAPFGEAVLRLGMGRDHGASLRPAVTVNDFPIYVPTNWRGYDQANRDRFYGVIEIPVPYAYLSSNNVINVTYPDDGGHVASATMQVFEFSAEIREPVPPIMIHSVESVATNLIFSYSNAPPDGYVAVWSKTDLTSSTWTTNQTGLPASASGSGSVTNPMVHPQEFLRIVLSNPPAPPPPPEPVVIEFTAPDYSDGPLNGQQNWNAEAGWAVADYAGVGRASTSADVEAAVVNEPIQLNVDETYILSVNFQFGGSYATPTNWVYAFLGGLKDSSAGESVSTGSTAADANIQILANSDSYRLLNNWSQVGSQISTGTLDGGDVLQFDYQLTLGDSALNTSYRVRLRNLTDGTDTGTGTVAGVDDSIYNALTGAGAYGFFQSITPGNHGSGLSGVQVNSVSTNLIP